MKINTKNLQIIDKKMKLLNYFSNFFYKTDKSEEKTYFSEKNTKKKNKTIVPYQYESIDNYDNGYRGIFTHKVTPLSEYEFFEFEKPKEYEFKRREPIYVKRDFTNDEKRMILEYYMNKLNLKGC